MRDLIPFTRLLTLLFSLLIENAQQIFEVGVHLLFFLLRSPNNHEPIPTPQRAVPQGNDFANPESAAGATHQSCRIFSPTSSFAAPLSLSGNSS